MTIRLLQCMRFKESELSVEDEPFETTEETPAIVEEKDERTAQQNCTDTTASELATKIREQELIKCEKCGKFVTATTLTYTHCFKCGGIRKSRPKQSAMQIHENMQEEATPNPVPIQKVVKDKPQPA